MEFRLLRADEIDCRVATVKQNGVSVLLYKDARCDMNILDETVGAFNWKRSHSRENANCTVELWDASKNQWIAKEDTGTESYTEKEKGLASDSFKRACFNWGIGRELYTAPFIWITADKCKIVPVNGGKYTCYDKFEVTEIGYDAGRRINRLVISLKGKEVYTFGSKIRQEPKEEPQEGLDKTPITQEQCDELFTFLAQNGIDPECIKEGYSVKRIQELARYKYDHIHENIEQLKDYQKSWKRGQKK